MSDENELIYICDKCLTASCWHGEFMCDAAYVDAGIVQKTRKELDKLNYEHPDKLFRRKIKRYLWIDIK